MVIHTLPTPTRDGPWWNLAVIVCAAVVAVASARDQAGSWNDGSRLATIESLVDRHTLAIDDSVFVRPPQDDPSRPAPYVFDEAGLNVVGTRDKLFIDGHYYSDKSPVPALFL